jgi:hypothetical protein
MEARALKHEASIIKTSKTKQKAKPMGIIAQFKRWQAARQEKRVEKLTALAADLDEAQQHDLLALHQRGFVRAKASGQSITRIYADVENLIRKRLRVVVSPGTYFLSAGSHQNMVTTANYTFVLSPRGKEHLSINAACINANRPVPGARDRFNGVNKVPENVARFLVEARNADPMAIQAGVWTLTDGYSAHQVQRHLVARDRYGNTHQAVSDAHIAEARRILDRLGIRHNL